MLAMEQLGQTMISKSRFGGLSSKQEFVKALEGEIRKREQLPPNASVATQVNDFLYTEVGKRLYEAYTILPDESYAEEVDRAPRVTKTERVMINKANEMYLDPANVRYRSPQEALLEIMDNDIYCRIREEQRNNEYAD